MMSISPITLQGTYVRLEPPAERHLADLLVASQRDDIWEYLPFGPYRTIDEWRAAIQRWRVQAEQGSSTSFVIVRLSDERAVGMTAYLDIQPKNRALEIGGTWLTPQVQRTALNTECKYLLLRHAFETLGFVRVQLKTDVRNLRSQRAIERLGAVKEGVLRKHVLTRGGYQRDTVMYSIVDSEWHAVKERLEGFLKHNEQSTVNGQQ
jgi:RimJ/RimL family protein N-acetyltransferase